MGGTDLSLADPLPGGAGGSPDVEVAGPWSTALPDWRERIMSGRSLIPALPLFDAVAAKALRIFKRLRVPDLIGQPTYGEVCDEWVFDFVRVVFGSYDPVLKRRMIREFFLGLPKKNGKSAIAAAIIVVAAIMNERPYAELLLIAPTKTIAAIAYDQARGIILADPELSKLFFPPQDHLKQIVHRRTGAVIAIKAADTDAVTGSKAAFTLIDETHEFAAKANAAAVFTEIRGALAARPDGFLLQITTQSKKPPAGVFKAELETARAVRDGELKRSMLAVIYELPPEVQKKRDAWKDRRTWGLVNPNLGRSVDLSFLEDELAKAEREGPAALALLASQHFNVEIGLGLGASTWTGAKHWEAAGEEGLTLEAILERSEVVTVGIDAGGLDDLFGLAVLGRERETHRWLLWTHAWAQAEVLDLRPENGPVLLDFVKDRDVTLVPSDDPTGDVRGVADVVEMVLASGLLPEKDGIGLDPYGVSAVLDELVARGISDEQFAGIKQGAPLSPAIWGMERKLKDGTLRHGARRMMAWVLGNAKTEQRGSAVLITKEVAGRAKIDPLIAALCAFTLMSRNPEAASGSYLEAGVVEFA